jgi:uncharacterized protein (TIGR03435 family)
MLSLRVAAIATIAVLCVRAERLEFELASVRPGQDVRGGSIARTPGGLIARNAAFSTLIEMAFQTKRLDLSALPDSLRSQPFDIVAKASGKISGDQYWAMLQALLEDRFHLKYHRETKDAQIYALIFAKGKNLGPKIQRSVHPDCPVNPRVADFCGVQPRPGLMIGQRVSMARIARELSPFAGRPVQDQTTLTGSFDFRLTWTPDQFRSDDGKVAYLNGAPIDTAGPSFFTAIQEQLGLKLESQKGQVEILVIDHAESPSEN